MLFREPRPPVARQSSPGQARPRLNGLSSHVAAGDLPEVGCLELGVPVYSGAGIGGPSDGKGRFSTSKRRRLTGRAWLIEEAKAASNAV